MRVTGKYSWSRVSKIPLQKFDLQGSLVIHINSTNISPIMIINRIYEYQNLLSL